MREQIKILIIDDNEDDIQKLVSLLISEGYPQPTIVKDQKSFENEYSLNENYDVIISEHEIWGLNSLQIFNMSKQKCPDVIFIVLSNKISDDFGVELLKEGIDIYFLKNTLLKLPPVIEKLYLGRHAGFEIKRLKELNDELNEAYKEIDTQNKNIKESILFAKRIQNLTLPKIDSLLKNFPEAFILYRPKDIVSGDFYWFRGTNGIDNGYCNGDCKKFMIAIGDCTGHGVSGALLSMIGYNLLNDIVIDGEILTNPTEILSQLDVSIRKLLKQDTNNACGYQDGIDMSFITIDKEIKKIYYCGCKRPLLYLVKPEKKIIVYKGEPYFVGGFSERGPKTFKTQEIDYQNDDIIYMLSDGYTDQFGGERNRKFMHNNFASLLIQMQHLPLNYQSQLLEQKLIKWQGTNEQTDDIVVMGIKL